MTLIEEIKEIKSDKAGLRSFGLIVGGIFTLLGLLYAHKHGIVLNFWIILGVVLMILGVSIPQSLRYPHQAWMALGLVLGFVIGPILFSIFYFLTFVPIAMISRLAGKKFLNLEFLGLTKSYWIAKPIKENQRKSAESQF